MKNDEWLIWSNEHGAWWRASNCGYTRIIWYAGRYTEERAKEIAHNANRYIPDGGPPDEVAIRISEMFERSRENA